MKEHDPSTSTSNTSSSTNSLAIVPAGTSTIDVEKSRTRITEPTLLGTHVNDGNNTLLFYPERGYYVHTKAQPRKQKENDLLIDIKTFGFQNLETTLSKLLTSTKAAARATQSVETLSSIITLLQNLVQKTKKSHDKLIRFVTTPTGDKFTGDIESLITLSEKGWFNSGLNFSATYKMYDEKRDLFSTFITQRQTLSSYGFSEFQQALHHLGTLPPHLQKILSSYAPNQARVGATFAAELGKFLDHDIKKAASHTERKPTYPSSNDPRYDYLESKPLITLLIFACRNNSAERRSKEFENNGYYQLPVGWEKDYNAACIHIYQLFLEIKAYALFEELMHDLTDLLNAVRNEMCYEDMLENPALTALHAGLMSIVTERSNRQEPHVVSTYQLFLAKLNCLISRVNDDLKNDLEPIIKQIVTSTRHATDLQRYEALSAELYDYLKTSYQAVAGLDINKYPQKWEQFSDALMLIMFLNSSENYYARSKFVTSEDNNARSVHSSADVRRAFESYQKKFSESYKAKGADKLPFETSKEQQDALYSNLKIGVKHQILKFHAASQVKPDEQAVLQLVDQQSMDTVVAEFLCRLGGKQTKGLLPEEMQNNPVYYTQDTSYASAYRAATNGASSSTNAVSVISGRNASDEKALVPAGSTSVALAEGAREAASSTTKPKKTWGQFFSELADPNPARTRALATRNNAGENKSSLLAIEAPPAANDKQGILAIEAAPSNSAPAPANGEKGKGLLAIEPAPPKNAAENKPELPMVPASRTSTNKR